MQSQDATIPPQGIIVNDSINMFDSNGPYVYRSNNDIGYQDFQHDTFCNRSEIDIGRALLRFAASPASSRLPLLQLSNPYTNYFYKSLQHTDGIGLVVPDVPELRDEAAKLELAHLVYFGHNTDPVTICSLVEVYNKLIKRRQIDDIMREIRVEVLKW